MKTMTNFPLEHDCVAKEEQDEMMKSVPECPESCELKQQFLETPKEEFNAKKVSTDFMLDRDAGYSEEIEELFTKENLNIQLEEKRMEILELEGEIGQIALTLEDSNNRLKTLKEEFLKLIPFDIEYIKEIIDGSSEEK